MASNVKNLLRIVHPDAHKFVNFFYYVQYVSDYGDNGVQQIRVSYFDLDWDWNRAMESRLGCCFVSQVAMRAGNFAYAHLNLSLAECTAGWNGLWTRKQCAKQCKTND